MHGSSAIQLARSVLFAPGNHARRVAKALASDADLVVLDLEDAVPITHKAAARRTIREALSQSHRPRVYVRTSSLSGGEWEADLEAVVCPGLDGIVLPKVEAVTELCEIDARMAVLEKRAGLERGTFDVMPIIESARGVWDCAHLAAATPRVRRLIFGGADYTLDLDLEWTPEEHELSFARARLAHASRVAGIEPPIDTAILQLKDAERFLQSTRNGKRMGFQGKLCLHPDQVRPCHGVFAPSQVEVERAKSIVEAFEVANASGSAAIELNGLFIDLPVVLRARKVLATAALCVQANAERTT
jgi:citrate lyase subunit beta/citryl-CoA lyase